LSILVPALPSITRTAGENCNASEKNLGGPGIAR
jgi:hypothetical protein